MNRVRAAHRCRSPGLLVHAAQLPVVAGRISADGGLGCHDPADHRSGLSGTSGRASVSSSSLSFSFFFPFFSFSSLLPLLPASTPFSLPSPPVRCALALHSVLGRALSASVPLCRRSSTRPRPGPRPAVPRLRRSGSATPSVPCVILASRQSAGLSSASGSRAYTAFPSGRPGCLVSVSAGQPGRVYGHRGRLHCVAAAKPAPPLFTSQFRAWTARPAWPWSSPGRSELVTPRI